MRVHCVVASRLHNVTLRVFLTALLSAFCVWQQGGFAYADRTLAAAGNCFVRSAARSAAVPADDGIAFATVIELSRSVEGRQLTSEQITNI